jgi:hypothetical protein
MAAAIYSSFKDLDKRQTFFLDFFLDEDETRREIRLVSTKTQNWQRKINSHSKKRWLWL